MWARFFAATVSSFVNSKILCSHGFLLLNSKILCSHGFLLPEREIPATGLETFEAIKVVAEEMVAQFVEPEIRRRVNSSQILVDFSPLLDK